MLLKTNMPEFSSHESVSLEKNVELIAEITETNTEEIDNVYEVHRCVGWIQSNGFQRVCLQFPDHLLPDSTDVALKLQNILGQTVYVLGDTAYESCCIDYVAAGHVNADAIIHFGPTCFSRTSANVPYLNIYEKHALSFDDLGRCISQKFDGSKDVILVLDSGYIHYYDNISSLFMNCENIVVQKIDEELLDLKDRTVIFIGTNQRKILNIDLNHRSKSLYQFDPNKKLPEIVPFKIDAKILKRRYFLMEKIRDAQTIGIVIGTLGVKNYLKIIERLKKLIQLRGKKYYLISVGKPTVAKLANFAEIDVIVMITCAMNEIYESRDFYKPIVTPFDVEMALNSNKDNLQFSYDYNRYLNELKDIDSISINGNNETDVSLLTGNLRSNVPMEANPMEQDYTGNSTEVALKSEGTVAVNSNFGAGFLNERSWKGLEQNLGQTDVKRAEEGRKGIAQGYENERV